ncbi:MAG: YkgJ family cysteine cluster protein [Spirochaetales bacterium]|nr:YkgJ family cysteine cluster protein [Spirochaetales bacterium]
MNSERERIVEMFGDTYMGRSLAELSSLYDQVEEENSSFCSEYGIHCTGGCGSCCEHFMPDITPLEARMIASYILLMTKDFSLVDKVQQIGLGHCPLYDRENPYHCQVYSVRPLVCRLFGQCASRAKDGSKVFIRCRFEGGKAMPEKLLFTPESPVRTMDEYGIKLQALNSGSGEDVQDLDVAVTNSLGEVAMVASYLGLKRNSSDDDDSTPTPSPQDS